MKIAMITVTKNDNFRFDEWCKYYNEYKDEIDVHIIVDDASDPEYVYSIKSFFTNSIIIERKVNGGSTAAVNDGIREALKDKDVDAIMVFDNDIKVKKGSFKILYDYLYSDPNLGMVGPLVLKKDSEIIEDFGVNIGWFVNHFLYQKKSLSDVPKGLKMYVDSVPGGISLSKREYYEKIGLQDETIFMYCDERDMAYRTKKGGYKEGVTSDAITWHQHIKCPYQTRRLKSNYLIARNRIYLEKKHFGVFKSFVIAFSTMALSLVFYLRDFFNSSRRIEHTQTMQGVFAGLVGNMSNDNLWY